MKVFVVTSGIYSDYSINAIFSTKELAEENCNKFNNDTNSYEHRSVEEWDVDFEKDFDWNFQYQCMINVKTGDFFNEYESRKYDSWTDKPFSVCNSGLRVFSHKNAEHARKLAMEARQAYLRKQTEVKSEN